MKVLVVHCHPDPDSFIAAARDRAVATLERRGHEVRVTDLYAEGFRPELSAWERDHQRDPPDTKPEIAEHVDNLRWCESIVLTYPTWWAGQPAMLKGWFDRVWVIGVAYELPEGSNRIRPLLSNVRRLVVVTTHGSGKLVNMLEGEGGKRVVTRALRVLCHRSARSIWVAAYGVDRSTPASRARFLDRVERVMKRL